MEYDDQVGRIRGVERGIKEPLCMVLVFFGSLDDVKDVLSGVAHYSWGVVCDNFRLWMGVESSVDRIRSEMVIRGGRMGMKNVPAHLLEPFPCRRQQNAHPT
jgi:hypothetical protein